VSILDTLLIDNHIGSPEFLGPPTSAEHSPGDCPLMPILLWYMPFTMFYGSCDLLYSGLELEMNEGRPAGVGEVGPKEVATQPASQLSPKAMLNVPS
jgi:hypothetical protein